MALSCRIVWLFYVNKDITMGKAKFACISCGFWDMTFALFVLYVGLYLMFIILHVNYIMYSYLKFNTSHSKNILENSFGRKLNYRKWLNGDLKVCAFLLLIFSIFILDIFLIFNAKNSLSIFMKIYFFIYITIKIMMDTSR